MGRVLTDQRTNGVTQAFPYTYNLDGSVASVNYPWGELVTFTPGGAGRPLTESGVSIFGTVNYVTAAHYTPGGAVCSISSSLLNATRNYTFNSRLQPQHYHITSIPWGGNGAPTPCSSPTWTAGWLDLAYNYVDSSGHNNGNLVSVLDNTDWAKSQSFSYDSLNRLATAQSYGQNASNHYQCWAETYTYDPWGNLYQFAANTTTQSAYIGCSQESGLNSTANTKNQLTSYNYDAAGNVISIPSVATYTYNAENQLTSTAGVTYTYDGDGKRVMKSSGTLYWYGLNSGPLMETNLTGTANFLYFFFNGQIINRREFGHGNILDTYVLDQLGNTSIVSGYSGAWDQSYYYPFGGERVYAGNVGNHYKFTGKERDPESGLDDFGARFMASSMGRFMSPDPENAGASSYTPQSWNAYAYVLNNPLNLIDPFGLYPETFCQTSSVSTGYTDDNGKEVIAHTESQTTCSEWDNGLSDLRNKDVALNLTPLPPLKGDPNKVFSCTDTAGYRLTQAALGATNLALAVVKAGELAKLDAAAVAAAPETGGASLVVAAAGSAYGQFSIGGQAFSGAGQLYSARTGDAETGEKMTQLGDIAAGPVLGISTLAITHDLSLAQRNANLENAYALGPALVKGKLKQKIIPAVDLALTTFGLSGAGCHP